jgi:hypothetical protein
MPAIAIPAIVSAVGMGVNAYQQHKAQGALNAATANSEGIAASQEKRANQAFDIGTPLVQHAGSYYDTLLRGNRSQMAEATAGPRKAINDQYAGAGRSLERSGVQGAVRDLAKANLSRSRAGDVAHLTMGVQPMAAAALGDLGEAERGHGFAGLSGAAGTYGGIMGERLQQQRFISQQGSGNGQAVGSMLFDILNGIGNRNKPSASPNGTWNSGGYVPVGSGYPQYANPNPMEG